MKKSMLRFLCLLLVLTLLPDAYIWWRHAGAWPLGWQMAYGLTSAAVATGIVAMLTRWMPHRPSLLLFFSTLLGIAMPKLAFAVADPLAGWPVALALAAVVLACTVYGFTWGWRRLRVRHETFCFDHLPAAFDGYRIVQFSDLHAGTLAGQGQYVKRLVDLINRQKADMVVFTGDLINDRPREVEPFVGELTRIQAPDGVFSILGNHDYGPTQQNAHRLCELQRQMGWIVLNDEHRFITRGDERIALVGVQNSGTVLFYTHGDLQKAVAGLNESTFQLLLSHTPTHWRREVLPTTRIPLTLSGHTHGGQMRLGRLSPAMNIYREWGGRYQSADGRWLYVSLGVGGSLPFRLGAWPEITVITLTCSCRHQPG